MSEFDDDMPGGFRDADFEMADLVAGAKREQALKRKGICAHGSMFAPPNGPVKCNDCGKVFPNEAAAHEERREILS